MKTTINIPDALLNEARSIVQRDNATLRELVLTGLRYEIQRRKHDSESVFHLRDASVGGEGVTSEFSHVAWSTVRDAAYGEDAGAPQ